MENEKQYFLRLRKEKLRKERKNHLIALYSNHVHKKPLKVKTFL